LADRPICEHSLRTIVAYSLPRTFSVRSLSSRPKKSWRIRFENGVDAAGRRKRGWLTVKGSRQDARRELTRILSAADGGTLVEPSKATIA
jgi:hypothetical protein